MPCTVIKATIMTRFKHTSILLIFLAFFTVSGFSLEPSKGGTQSGNGDQTGNKMDVKKEYTLLKKRAFTPLRWTGFQFDRGILRQDLPNPNSISNNYFIRPEVRTEFRLARFMENTLQVGFTKVVIAF